VKADGRATSSAGTAYSPRGLLRMSEHVWDNQGPVTADRLLLVSEFLQDGARMLLREPVLIHAGERYWVDGDDFAIERLAGVIERQPWRWGQRSALLDRAVTRALPAIRVTQPQEWRRELRPSSEDRWHGAVTSETVAFGDTPLPDIGTAAAEAWGIHHWSPPR
jgi:hypothetical protein